MTPRAARLLAAYRRQMPASTVTVRRTGAGAGEIVARARVVGLTPDELVGGLDQTMRSVIVLAEDVTFPTPLRRGDQVIMPNGDVLRVEVCDADRRSIDGTLIAYELTVKG